MHHQFKGNTGLLNAYTLLESLYAQSMLHIFSIIAILVRFFSGQGMRREKTTSISSNQERNCSLHFDILRIYTCVPYVHLMPNLLTEY